MGERDSKEVGGGQLEVVSDEEKAPREARNAYEQFRRLEEMITDAIAQGHFRLRPSTLMELNRLAIEGLVSAPGRYRLGEMTIPGSEHVPPPPDEVPGFVDEMCDYVNDNWEQSALHLAAYVMWRLNWIHPFQNGNGRTARASSYLVLCARLGHDLPGEKTMPSHIAGNKQPYYTALETVDAAWKQGELDLAGIQSLLEDTLIKQIREAATSTLRESRPKRKASASHPAATSTTAVAVPETGMSSAVKAAIIGGAATVIGALIALGADCSGGAAQPPAPKANPEPEPPGASKSEP